MSVPPWFLFLLILALALSLGYALFRGRYGWRIVLYWAVVFVVLLLCEAGAEEAGFELGRMGDLRLAPDLAGGVVAVLALWAIGL